MKIEANKYANFHKFKNKYFKHKKTNNVVKIVGLAVYITEENKPYEIYILQLENECGKTYDSICNLLEKNLAKIIYFERENDKNYGVRPVYKFLEYFEEI